MIERLLDASSGKLLIPILFVVLGTALIKGLYSLHQSRSGHRRDFLDLWVKRDGQDDLWIEVVIRHLFGTYIPASIIRSLMKGPQAAQSLLDVSEFWELLQFNDETLEVQWKNRSAATKFARTHLIIALNLLYFVAMFPALLCLYAVVIGNLEMHLSIMLCIYSLILSGVALRSLSRSEMYKTAQRGGPRWLGLP